MSEDIKKLEIELKENKELIDELEGDYAMDGGDEFWGQFIFGKIMGAKQKQAEILEKIYKIKKNKSE